MLLDVTKRECRACNGTGDHCHIGECTDPCDHCDGRGYVLVEEERHEDH